MGKTLVQQARGKGGPTYRSPSFRFKGIVRHRSYNKAPLEGVVKDIIKCPGHSAPLARVLFSDGEESLVIAPEGIRKGESVVAGPSSKIGIGNLLPLMDVPEGTLIYNIESKPGDGGKFARAGGVFARVVMRSKTEIIVELPSKKKHSFNPACRASIGVVAGGGRKEKPFVKAGRRYYAKKAKNKLYPKVSGTSQNSVDHPFGGSSSNHKGKPTIAPKNAPPGRKVGKIRPRRVGKRK